MIQTFPAMQRCAAIFNGTLPLKMGMFLRKDGSG